MLLKKYCNTLISFDSHEMQTLNQSLVSPPPVPQKPPGCLIAQRQGITQLCTQSQRHKWGTGHACQTKGSRPPSHLSSIPDMLIPTVVAGRHGRDRLEVRVSRCVYAVRPLPENCNQRGFGKRGSCCFGGWWGGGGEGFEKKIPYPILPSIWDVKLGG